MEIYRVHLRDKYCMKDHKSHVNIYAQINMEVR
jgi:hypothetical protein